MPGDRRVYKTIDEYLKAQPAATQKVLRTLRATIQAAAPGATQTINYGIPTFQLNGNLVHFAAFEMHIGFYPTPGGIQAFRKDLSRYVSAKGSVQFPLDKPMPLGLITRIVKFRVKQQMQMVAKGKKK
ncbi:MAG TPA: DUF1801 domain-containing protein [Anaerolineales bacterium]|nr:DUF1801 domain-containing protein [Anaerolineales bacterium]